eukprot:m.579550 g.579550  ORF g.579550 m.579550 type:complete len:159 (+) comp22314_c1_seq50:191-667(+)
MDRPQQDPGYKRNENRRWRESASDLKHDANVIRTQVKPFNKFALGIAAAGLFGLGAVFWPFVSPALRGKFCLPYLPATTEQVNNVVTALRLRAPTPTSRVIDLGSGDGRLVIASALAGYTSEGVELNHWLNWYARISALFKVRQQQRRWPNMQCMHGL